MGYEKSCVCVGEGRIGHWVSRRHHQEYHRKWEKGLIVPTGLIKAWDRQAESAIVKVTQYSSAAAHHEVFALAMLFRDECGFDSAGWPQWDNVWGYTPADRATAFIALREKRFVFGTTVVGTPTKYAVGLSIVLNKEFREEHEGHEELFRQPTLARVFVCNSWRQQGIGTQLVQAALTHFNITAGKLYWQPPLSDAGLALMNHTLRSSETAPWWITENCEWKKTDLGWQPIKRAQVS